MHLTFQFTMHDLKKKFLPNYNQCRPHTTHTLFAKVFSFQAIRALATEPIGQGGGSCPLFDPAAYMNTNRPTCQRCMSYEM